MQKDSRHRWIIFWSLSMLVLLLGSGTNVMAGDDSLNSGIKSGKQYRQHSRAVLSEKEGERLLVGSSLAIELPSETVDEFSGEPSDGEDSNSRFLIRTADMFLQFEKIGKISLGQGETASQILTRTDLSGTDLSGYYGMDDTVSGIFFYDGEASKAEAPLQRWLDDSSGNAHKDRFRYDTPNLNGFSASFSTFSNQDQEQKTGKAAYDAALSYSGRAGELEMAAAIAYAEHPSDENEAKERHLNGSASVAFSGFSITVAAGNEDDETEARDSKAFYYGKLGYSMEFWKIGPTALAIDYGRFEKKAGDADPSKTMGIMFVQKIQDWSSEIYAGFRTSEEPEGQEGIDAEAVNALMFGTRIEF